MMKSRWLVLTTIAVTGLLVACDAGISAPQATPPLVDTTPPATFSPTLAPADVSATLIGLAATAIPVTGIPVDVAIGLPSVVQNARLQHAMQRGTDPASIAVDALEIVVWDSSCLGAALEDVVCQPGSVPGYRFALVDGAGRYVYHTDETGSIMHLAEAPPVDVGEVLLEWRQTDLICQQILIDANGALVFGECGLPLVRSLMTMNPQPDSEYGLFLATYAPFEADTVAGHVAFKGRGATVATLAEQRMIGEWAKFNRDVAWSGRAGAAWGLVLTWISEPDCASVNVVVMGVAYAQRCDTGGVDRDLGQMRLNAEQLATLYSIVDTYQPFDWTDPVAGPGLAVQVAGHGDLWPTPEQQAAVSDFARELLFQFPTQGYEFSAP